MLINLTDVPFEKWSENQKNSFLKKYGDVLDLELPKIIDDRKLDITAMEYFVKISGILEKNTSDEYQNAVFMDVKTKLEKNVMSILLTNNIEVVLSYWH